MELRSIKTFHTIVKFGSFYKAAEILNYSQPTISMRMKQLEQDLGVLLFERGKSLQLTKAGKLFYERTGDRSVLLFVCEHPPPSNANTDSSKTNPLRLFIGCLTSCPAGRT